RELGGRLVRLRFKMCSAFETVHTLYVRHHRARPDKSHILLQRALRQGPNWKEHSIEFLVPSPAGKADAAEAVELWIALGVSPIEFRASFTALHAVALGTGAVPIDAQTVRIALLMLDSASTFANTLADRLRYLVNQNYIATSNLTNFLQSFKLGDHCAARSEATLRDVIEQTK